MLLMKVVPTVSDFLILAKDFNFSALEFVLNVHLNMRRPSFLGSVDEGFLCDARVSEHAIIRNRGC